MKPGRVAELPIVRRFPELGTLPRTQLGSYPTPIDRVRLRDGRLLLLKRDDRSADPLGGNKVRGLEWLLGAVRAGDRVLTVGSTGSTHALLTAYYARRLGAEPVVVRWGQQMNDAAQRVDAAVRDVSNVIDAWTVPSAFLVAALLRLRPGTRWIPAGGSTPMAVLGHVNAGLELAEQVDRGACDAPERVVVPLGTGGTAAGLALGFRIAGLPTRVVAVRVVPRIVGRAGRVLRLAHSTAALIERMCHQSLPRVRPDDVQVEQGFYGGGYGRPLQLPADDDVLGTAGIALDDTYSRKAFAAALALGSRGTLLWLTFDGRLLQHSGSF
ncbi:MAG TPA: pyridoxal-phosphate dependent enzyme [Gemmatimonadaceae bacterium]|nr:pyridoxal-phosphate dependent enzyme [Gemmatimonadaceae bacterium]